MSNNRNLSEGIYEAVYHPLQPGNSFKVIIDNLWHIMCFSYFMDSKLESLVNELEALDKELVTVDGIMLKPSQCYRFETNPLHLMFNTNCPDELKKKVESILHKHVPPYESGSS